MNRRDGGDRSCLIEASELDLGTGLGIFEEHVFWSEVCVYNFARMNVTKRQSELFEDEACLKLAQFLLIK